MAKKVKFIGATDMQATWGRSRDPRPHLEEGSSYEIERIELHTWHTVYHLVGFAEQGPFNSVCFEE